MIFGAVPDPVTIGILLLFAICTVATVLPEVAGASIATTLSCVANLIAAAVASEFSDLLSTLISSIFLPSIPPASLISLTASSAPTPIEDPYDATFPESSKLAPILIVSPSDDPPPDDDPPSELVESSPAPQPASTPARSEEATRSEPNFLSFLFSFIINSP